MSYMDAMGYVEFYMEKVMFPIAEMLWTQPMDLDSSCLNGVALGGMVRYAPCIPIKTNH